MVFPQTQMEEMGDCILVILDFPQTQMEEMGDCVLVVLDFPQTQPVVFG